MRVAAFVLGVVLSLPSPGQNLGEIAGGVRNPGESQKVWFYQPTNEPVPRW